jgi:hypothetical protein
VDIDVDLFGLSVAVLLDFDPCQSSYHFNCRLLHNYMIYLLTAIGYTS